MYSSARWRIYSTLVLRASQSSIHLLMCNYTSAKRYKVKANVLTGKYAGIYRGRIAIRFKPSFKLTTGGKSFDVHPKYLKTIHKADGYEYAS